MAKYTITNQKELRRSFWVFCKEFGGEFEREANKKKHSFKLITTRVYYPGEHVLEIMVNGKNLGKIPFQLKE